MLQNKKIQMTYPLFELDLERKNSSSIDLDTLQINFETSFQASLGFALKKKQNSQVLVKVSQPISIEIRSNYIILKLVSSRKNIGFIQCSFQTKFQIMKLDLQSSEWQNLKGIRVMNQFQASSGQKQIQILVVQNQIQKFKEFLNILQMKNVVQLNFHPQFRAVRRVGKGVTAYVYQAVRLRDKKKVAIKSFKKTSYFSSDNGKGKMSFKKQMKILSELSHPGLSCYKGVFQTQNSIYIIFELLPISLFNFLKSSGIPSQEFTKNVIKKLLISLQYLHMKEIVHRDIKLDNIMLKNLKYELCQPIIIDFGLAEYIDSEYVIYEKCGTPGYVAPQVLTESQALQQNGNRLRHKKQSDIFSLGVIFYIMITGRSPFQGTQVKKVLEANKNCKITYQLPRFQTMNSFGLDILKMMLDPNPLRRITSSQALNHPYFTDNSDNNMKEQLRRRLSTQINISI